MECKYEVFTPLRKGGSAQKQQRKETWVCGHVSSARLFTASKNCDFNASCRFVLFLLGTVGCYHRGQVFPPEEDFLGHLQKQCEAPVKPQVHTLNSVS
jgi:hypothetical protein